MDTDSLSRGCRQVVEGAPLPFFPPQTVSLLGWLAFKRALPRSLSPPLHPPFLSPPHNIVVSFYWRREEGGVPQGLSHWLSAAERAGTKAEREGEEWGGRERDDCVVVRTRERGTRGGLRGRRNGSGEEKKKKSASAQEEKGGRGGEIGSERARPRARLAPSSK